MIVAMTETVLPLRRRREAQNLQEHVAQELLAEMGRTGVTRSALAEALGIAGPTLTKRLRGQQPMSVKFVEDASVLLGLNPRKLFDWEPPTTPGPGMPVSSG